MCFGPGLFLWDWTLSMGLKMRNKLKLYIACCSVLLPLLVSAAEEHVKWFQWYCCGAQQTVLQTDRFQVLFNLLLKVAQVLYVLKICPSFASVFVRTRLLALSKGLSCSLWTDNSQARHQTKNNTITQWADKPPSITLCVFPAKSYPERWHRSVSALVVIWSREVTKILPRFKLFPQEICFSFCCCFQ